jgi:hypothetical protein
MLGARVGRIQDQVDLDARRMAQDRDRLRSDRAGDESEAELLVERARARQIVHPDADMRDPGDERAGVHRNPPAVQVGSAIIARVPGPARKGILDDIGP